MNPTPTQLKTARSNAGLSKIALAELMQVSRMTVHNWEVGKHPMKSRDWEYLQMKLKRV